MLVELVVAAGAVASVSVVVEAIGRGPEGWLVVLGYDHWMAPILGRVRDSEVVEVRMEMVLESEGEEMVEWAEAA